MPFAPPEKILSARAQLCQVTELMKLYHLCCKYGLFEEAEKIALKTCEVDPSNAAALAAVRVAHLLGSMKHAGTVTGGKCLHNCPAAPTSPASCPNGDGEKKKAVNALKEQFHTYYKEGKYAEAEQCAAQALELEPDNRQAAAAFQMARIQKRLHGCKASSPTVDLNQLHNTFGALNACEQRCQQPMHYPKEKQIQVRLSFPISLNFKDAELGQIIHDLRDISGLNVVVDTAALKEAGIGLHKKISLSIENVSMATALKLLLQQAHLTYVIKDEVLQITTEPGAGKKCSQATGCPRAACAKIPAAQMKAMGRLSCGLYCGSIAAMPCGGIVTPGVAACVPCIQVLNALEHVLSTPENTRDAHHHVQ
jgi:tetratricopeptide (TPR) repeat protein